MEILHDHNLPKKSGHQTGVSYYLCLNKDQYIYNTFIIHAYLVSDENKSLIQSCQITYFGIT